MLTNGTTGNTLAPRNSPAALALSYSRTSDVVVVYLNRPLKILWRRPGISRGVIVSAIVVRSRLATDLRG